MRTVLLAVVVLIFFGGCARAERFDLDDLYRRIESLARRLVGQGRPEHGMARVPHADIDPKMALGPPQEGGTMRIIPPPGSPGGDSRVQPK
jgi:hypothetical protein